jgi:hypothetical protein
MDYDLVNAEVSPFMLDKPDLTQVKIDLLITFPNLSIEPSLGLGTKNKVAILNTANRPWAIIDSKFLLAALLNVEVQEFYFSPGNKPFQAEANSLDDKVLISQNHKALFENLKRFSPSSLYLRVSPHTKSEYLISLCRITFPNVVLIVEPYDLTCLFDRKVLGYESDQNKDYQSAMLGCAVALHYCDALIVKMGGERFDNWPKPRPKNIISFFPTSAYQSTEDTYQYPVSQNNNLSQQTELSKVRQVLYAGSASARELTSGIGSVDGANLIRYFDRVIQEETLQLTIINGAHFTVEEDQSTKFVGLIDRYGAKRSKQEKEVYFRAMPLDKVASLAINFDLGICCAHYAEDQVVEVTRVSLPNRMTTYLNAELPVIIDDRFEYASSLIEEFDAGKVIPAGDFEVFASSLAEIDIKKARQGVKRLKQFFQDQNNKNLASLLLVIR